MNKATPATGWARNPDGSLGYTWNPLTGCLNHNSTGVCLDGMFPCYACKLANGRLRHIYLKNKNTAPFLHYSKEVMKHTEPFDIHTISEPELPHIDPFYPRFWPEKVTEPYSWKRENSLRVYKPKGIFCCDMSDLFGIGIPHSWTKQVLDTIELCRNDRFYLLTKQPGNMRKYSPLPDNCWAGLTITGKHSWKKADEFTGYCESSVRFVSIEPLLTELNELILQAVIPKLNWIIIGACTGSLVDMQALRHQYPELSVMPYGKKWTLQPKLEWVYQIIKAAQDKPIFLKDNLMPLFVAHWGKGFDSDIWSDAQLRQDIPDHKM